MLATGVRARALTRPQAHRMWHAALRLFERSEVEPSGDDVLEIATDRNLSAYDAQFVVAALDLGIPLVTADRRLQKASPGTAVALEHFTA